MILIHFMAILGYSWHPNLHKTKEKFTNLSEAERKNFFQKHIRNLVCDKTILSRETKHTGLCKVTIFSSMFYQ